MHVLCPNEVSPQVANAQLLVVLRVALPIQRYVQPAGRSGWSCSEPPVHLEVLRIHLIRAHPPIVRVQVDSAVACDDAQLPVAAMRHVRI